MVWAEASGLGWNVVMPKGFELDLLKSFLEVMDTESITVAAKRLGLTQSTVSKHMTMLEARFSARLFYRDGRRVTATPAGHVLADHAQRILERLASLGPQHRSSVQQHIVKILVPPSVMALSLTSFFSIVQDHSPDLVLRMTEQSVEDVAEAMRQGDIDIAVLYAVPDMRGLTLVNTLAYPLHLVVSARSGALPPKFDSSDIYQMDFALPARPDGLRLQVDAFAASFGHKLNVKFEVGSVHTLKDLVASGLAASYLPWAAIAKEVHAGQLRLVPQASLSLSFSVIVPTGRARAHGIGRISDDLVSVLERQVALAVQDFQADAASGFDAAFPSLAMTACPFVTSAILLTRRWRVIMDAEVKRFGLTTATCRPLFYMGELGDGVRPKDLAEALEMERPSLGQLIDRLETQGLIRRQDDPHDRRGKTLFLTKAGREIYDITAGAAERVRRELIEGVTESDMAACMRVFGRIFDNAQRIEDDATLAVSHPQADARHLPLALPELPDVRTPRPAAVVAPRSAILAALAPLAAHAVWVHAARTLAAALLALFLAFQLELDTPYSAMTTVMIVSNPVQGMILQKSLYRFGGTLVGAVAAVMLMALFAQTPVLFLVGLACWMALCTGASTLLRGFRSYGAVLAGYTVALIAMPAVANPDAIFTLTMARLSVVCLGIVCSALVGALFTGHTAERDLDLLFHSLLKDLVGGSRIALRPGQSGALRLLRHTIGARLGGLDDAIRFAAAETPSVAARAPSLRDASAAMLGVLTSAPSLTELLVQQDFTNPLLKDWLAAADTLLARAQDNLSRHDDSAVVNVALDLGCLRRELESTMDSTEPLALTPELIGLADRLADFIGELERCLLGLPHPEAQDGARTVLRNSNFLDWSWAAKNATRAGLTVLIVGVIWFETAWSSGAIMMTGVIPNIGLFALRERPSDAVMDFVWGVCAASALGLFYLLWVFPQITGFPLLALWLTPPLVFGAAASTTPRLMFFALGFTVFFITLIAPGNPMVYDPSGFLNTALALVVGASLTAVAYQLILPVDARMLRRHLLIDLQRDFAAVLRGRKSLRAADWESRMHDRMRLLMARLRGANLGVDGPLRSGFDAIRLGRDILRLRALLGSDPEALAIARRGVAPMADGKARGAALKALHESVEAMRALTFRPEGGAQATRAEAILKSIAAIYAHRSRFFQQAATS
eukprot:gene14623-14747_t